MKHTIKTIALVAVFFTAGNGFARTDEERAYSKALEAIALIQTGDIENGILLLEEAQQLDPRNIVYPYEIAYANYLNGDSRTAIDLLQKLLKQDNVNDMVYQLLGALYSMEDDREKAISIFDEGLERFPSSGLLYLERGNMELFVDEYGAALNYYEKGIDVDPGLPSNYYWASMIYCNTEEEVWGMIYGEIFMNLERDTERTEAISKLLFDTYKSEIKFHSDTSYSVSFSRHASLDISALLNPEGVSLPFGMAVYEITLSLSIRNETSITLASLNRIRTNFIDLYFKNNHNEKYPNILFDYKRTMIEEGHFEAYNYWILMMGDEEEFYEWYTFNKKKWDDFVEWFIENPLEINNENKFHRTQYR